MRPPVVLRRISVVALLATVGATVVAPAASADDAKTATSSKTTFRADGLRATWSKVEGLRAGKATRDTAMVEPGQRFAIRVRPTKKAARSARARITVTRTAGDAGRKRVVLRRTLRKGTVRLRVAKTPGTTYRVTVRIGKRKRTVRVVVNRPTPDVVPAPPPAPVCNPNAGFLGTPTTAQAGFLAPVWISNDSGGGLEHGVGVIWERQVGAGWATAEFPRDLAVPAVLLVQPPGVSPKPRIVSVWSTLTPGTYRMALPVRCQSTGAQGVLYSAPIAVTRLELPLTNDVAPLPLTNDMAPPPGAGS